MAKMMFKKNKENNKNKKEICPRVFRAENKESFPCGPYIQDG